MYFTILIDFAASLAIMAMLAESYGVVRRRLVGAALAPVLLGVLFGLIAMVEMFRPLEPFDGLIVDMRNVPIALAGAFLGWRGLIPCLIIAASARIGIGGVGVQAGLIAMVIAGLAGMIWAQKTAHLKRRGIGQLLGLACAMSLHLSAAFVLPHEMAAWFFGVAAGPIFLLNLISITLVGAFLERENRRILGENQLLAAATRHPVSGLLTAPAFTRDVSNALEARPLGTFAGLMIVSAEHHPLRGLLMRSGAITQNVAVDRHHIADFVTHADLVGQSSDGRILIPLTKEELLNSDQLAADLRRNSRGLANQTEGRQGSAQLAFEVLPTPDPAVFLSAVESAPLAAQPSWLKVKASEDAAPHRSKLRSAARRARLFDPAEHDALFLKADFLINRSRTN